MIEDGARRSAPTTLVNAQAGARLSSRVRLVLDVFNVFDQRVSDIDYFYVSRLPSEPETGIEDVHLHPAAPRSIRIGVLVTR